MKNISRNLKKGQQLYRKLNIERLLGRKGQISSIQYMYMKMAQLT